ncbi:pyrE [Wigglesworthia glossinidia endosymbiont of Glossina brevipalpis]|uniref:Orotate phosphoribosyltransferase n=1 Tax=Wigglesworthia glossinidia brevipalpis TaxID=36870 RepID=Q8D2F4_WIGBR|nr:pyrE [Wigglesworthia glossinidia endosymbiont of Glossina brevipalpis]
MDDMKNYKYEFIKYAIKNQALKFGKFKLKSGRISPYFFDMGSFNNGKDLLFLGKIYSYILSKKELCFDMIFGLSYKGISIAISSVIFLKNFYNKNISFCFNRKEHKNYGEKGLIIGKKPSGNIILMDDVITSGSTIYEIEKIIDCKKVNIKGVVIALDREEKGLGDISATKNIENYFNFKVISIITVTDIINFLIKKENILEKKSNLIKSIKSYKKYYGI